jgi:DNA-binding NtrC family response regulator
MRSHGAHRTKAATMNTPAKILIVDDEEVVRLSYMRILAATNCHVKAAWTWVQVAQAMQHETFDVVLLDLRMPEMDGMKVLKALKSRWPESEVIIITGYPTLESAKEAVTLGAYDYLTKPVGPDQVIEAANAAMLHKRWALRSDADLQGAPSQQAVSPAVPGRASDKPDFLRKLS